MAVEEMQTTTKLLQITSISVASIHQLNRIIFLLVIKRMQKTLLA